MTKNNFVSEVTINNFLPSYTYSVILSVLNIAKLLSSCILEVKILYMVETFKTKC